MPNLAFLFQKWQCSERDTCWASVLLLRPRVKYNSVLSRQADFHRVAQKTSLSRPPLSWGR